MPEVAHDATVAVADSLRGLIDAVRLAAAPVDALAAAQALIEQAQALLDPHRFGGLPAQGALDGSGFGLRSLMVGEPNAYFPYSPIVGPRNPLAPPVRMWPAAHGRMHGSVELGAPYAGPPGLVHGGVVALLFDELLGACAILNEAPGFTGTLTVKYLRGTPLRTPLSMEAWIDRIEGRKTFVTGELRSGDVVTATATGIFIATAHQIDKQ
jgi:acyl-coenzyme A thioesterase PaaI-like protein